MAGTYVYVDGFNLYYRALKGTRYKWLDLVRLAECVLDEPVARLRYFTARVAGLPHNPQAPARRQAFLRALGADPLVRLHYGSFRPREKRGELIRPRVPGINVATIKTFEEKGSDVNLASWALADAYEGQADKVVLLTNDSDLREPATILRNRGTTVGVIIPKKGLKPNTVPADFYKTLRPGDLKACQLPDPVLDSKGQIHKPEIW